jgi:signal transduction histidine kinase
VACQWRIRHKLMIGLGFVVGIIALILAGTLKGLASYRITTNSVDSKLIELYEAQNLKTAMTSLASAPDQGTGLAEELAQLRTKAALARKALAAYQHRLEETLQKHRDPDGGFEERQRIQALEERFARLDQALEEVTQFDVLPLGQSWALRNHPKIEKAISDLVQTADELQEVIYQDLYRRITDAKGQNRSAMILVISTSVVGVLLMISLLRFFYRWTFSPIRDLQQGVHRVAEGDFEHRIQVHSGDEMEELAAAFNDMTGRLEEMYRDLARQVNERSRQLVRSERLASVGFLAAGVAHEINNPLASIAFCSEALERRLFPDGLPQANDRPQGTMPRAAFGVERSDEEVVTKYLKMIQEEAFRCKRITQRLLEFSRSSERRREPTDLGALVQSVLDVVQHLENSKGKPIVFQPAGTVTAWVNAQEIKSVVLNLVVNALESMDEGGTLTITLAAKDRMAELVFRDQGCGMTAEVLENIFEPFFTRSRTGKGTGLGLSISHRVISQHGGDIEAYSGGPGQGSTFTVRIPLQPVEPARSESGRLAA